MNGDWGLASERKLPLIVALKRKHEIQKKRCKHYNVRGPGSFYIVAPPYVSHIHRTSSGFKMAHLCSR